MDSLLSSIKHDNREKFDREFVDQSAKYHHHFNQNNNDICHDHFRIEKEQSMLADCHRLIEQNLSLDQADKYGITLLHIAAAKAYPSVVRFLLRHHVNVDQVDDTGATALHLCAKHEQGLIIKLLLDARANPTLRDRFGRKPSEVCTPDRVIRTILLKAENKFEEQRQCAEQSDDSLEEEEEKDDDDSLWNENNDDPIRILFMPIPQRQQPLSYSQTMDDETKMTGIFDGTEIDQSNDESSLPAKLPNDDLATLPEISEQSLLYDLEMRYRHGQIYTYIGDILIALNPFDLLPIYGRKISELFKHTQSIASLSPHIYGCAERLYRNLLREQTSQCVVISGLSGSGKTESCKYIVQHVLSRSISVETLLNVKINQVNPLMEAFGNAKTYINNNSSRFGKYLEIHFSPAGNVLGAHLKEYLLEKSRVISHNNDEGNFHIFYYLFAGLSHDALIRNGLRIPSEHRYMSHNAELAQLDSARQVEYRKKFHMVKQSLLSIGFSADDVQSIFTILSAILHIGDVVFVPHGSNDGVRVKNNSTVDKIAELLQVSTLEFSSALVTELQITRGEQIFRERNIIQASECRDAFAKALYGRLFSWIVNGINSYLEPLEKDSISAHIIAVLDIFGFENFKSNSFEQICINLTNEHMQRFLNQHIYDLEVYDCQQEGIEAVDISYTDNHLVIETFLNKHTGILAILDEESRFPQATDQSLATKLHHGPGVQFGDIYSIPKDGGTSFTIRHYAAPVMYNMVGLLEKNRDFLPNSIVFVARTSNNLIIQELFRLNLNEKGVLPASPGLHNHHHHHPSTFHSGRRNEILNNYGMKNSPIRTLPDKSNGNTFERTGGTAMRTVAFHFKHSLTELIEKMNSCQCHFVRCIKPYNLRDKTTFLTTACVTRQLRYSGVLQMCEIRKHGYPLRIHFVEFLHRYNALVVCLLPVITDERSKESSYYRDRAIECLKRAGIDNYKVGRTKLLFRYWHTDQLHNLAARFERKVNVCQKVLRGWLARRKYARLREMHQLQLVFIRKFCDDINLTGQIYKTKMDGQIQFDKKRKFIQIRQQQQQQMVVVDDEDEDQVEKTMNFFDAILDQYLSESDTPEENRMKSRRSSSITMANLQPKSSSIQTNGLIPENRLGYSASNTNTSSSSSSSNSHKANTRPSDLHASHFREFQNIRCRFEQMTSGSTPSPPSTNNNVRRYTSEHNLNEVSAVVASSKPTLLQKNRRPSTTTTTTTSTEDLSSISTSKKLSPVARLSALLDKTNSTDGFRSPSNLLTANGTSASLIDLSSIDKLPATRQPQPRPRFRFVPPSGKNATLKEEPEPEQQQQQSNLRMSVTTSTSPTIPNRMSTYDNFDIRQTPPGALSMSPNSSRTSAQTYEQQTSPRVISPKQQPQQQQIGLVKPTVIHPQNIAHSAVNFIVQQPMTRSTHFTQSPEINIHHQQQQQQYHHQNGNSAFKPTITQSAVKSPPIVHEQSPSYSNNSHPPTGNLPQRSSVTTHHIIHPSVVSSGNGALGKNQQQQQQQPPPVPNVKRTESVHKPGVHVGMTNPNGPSTGAGLLVRHAYQQQQQQQIPHYHQSMLNLSSVGTGDSDRHPSSHVAQPATAIFGSRGSLQTTPPNFVKHPVYAPTPTTTNKTNGHHHQQQQQHHYPPPLPPSQERSKPTSTPLEDPILKWIQQINNSSSINGLAHPSQKQSPLTNGNSRSQQPQSYPYGSYIAAGSGLPTMNGSNYPHHHHPPHHSHHQQQQQQQHQAYLSQVNVQKHHAPQHTVPVQAYLGSPPPSRNGASPSSGATIYHFSQSNSQQISSSAPGGGGGGGHSRHHPHPHHPRNDVTVTTYL